MNSKKYLSIVWRRKAGGHRDVSSPEPHQELRAKTDPAAKLVATGKILSELYQIYLKQYKALLPEVTFLTEEAASEHLNCLL